MDVLGEPFYLLVCYLPPHPTIRASANKINRIGGVLAATLNNIPVNCTPDETAHFNPPPGQTCTQYAGAFAQKAGGYLLNPNAGADCQYCQYTTGNQYLATLNIKADEKWRDFGIFLVFCCTNWMLVYFFIYTVRIKGWGFGFGYLFGGFGKLAALVQKPFKGKQKNEQAGEEKGQEA